MPKRNKDVTFKGLFECGFGCDEDCFIQDMIIIIIIIQKIYKAPAMWRKALNNAD